MATKARVYRNEQNGELFHVDCLEEGDLTSGNFTPVKLDELDDDDDCEECSVVFLRGLSPDDEDDDDDDDDDEEEAP